MGVGLPVVVGGLRPALRPRQLLELRVACVENLGVVRAAHDAAQVDVGRPALDVRAGAGQVQAVDHPQGFGDLLGEVGRRGRGRVGVHGDGHPRRHAGSGVRHRVHQLVDDLLGQPGRGRVLAGLDVVTERRTGARGDLDGDARALDLLIGAHRVQHRRPGAQAALHRRGGRHEASARRQQGGHGHVASGPVVDDAHGPAGCRVVRLDQGAARADAGQVQGVRVGQQQPAVGVGVVAGGPFPGEFGPVVGQGGHAVSACGEQPEEDDRQRQGDQQGDRHLSGDQTVRRQHRGGEHRRGPRQPAEAEVAAGPEAVHEQCLRDLMGCH